MEAPSYLGPAVGREAARENDRATSGPWLAQWSWARQEPPGRGNLWWLREKGYEVDIVGSGSEALDWIRLDEPDLVILDVVMPIPSGFDVCRWIRSNPATRSTPIILLSARNQPSDMIAGDAAGADLYLKKPVHARRLVNLVEMFLSRDTPLLKRPPLPAQPNLERH